MFRREHSFTGKHHWHWQRQTFGDNVYHHFLGLVVLRDVIIGNGSDCFQVGGLEHDFYFPIYSIGNSNPK